MAKHPKKRSRGVGAPRSRIVDLHVGNRLRQLRLLHGVSQVRLAKALGITFQQVQKNESGVNRIGTSRLYQVSMLFDVPVQWFFDEMPDKVEGLATAHISLDDALEMLGKQPEDLLTRRETLQLMRFCARLGKKMRKQVLALALALGREE